MLVVDVVLLVVVVVNRVVEVVVDIVVVVGCVVEEELVVEVVLVTVVVETIVELVTVAVVVLVVATTVVVVVLAVDEVLAAVVLVTNVVVVVVQLGMMVFMHPAMGSQLSVVHGSLSLQSATRHVGPHDWQGPFALPLSQVSGNSTTPLPHTGHGARQLAGVFGAVQTGANVTSLGTR